MNQRDLSEKLDKLATKLEELRYDSEDLETDLQKVADQLRKLSTENYAPGNSVSWADLKPKSVNKKFTDKTTGKELPF